MYKALIFAAILAALVPSIKMAQKTASNYQHMLATVNMLSDPSVLRDTARFNACVAAAQGQSNAMGDNTSPLHSAVINADPSQCQPTTGPRWVAVR